MNKFTLGSQLYLPVQIKLEKKFEHYLGDANGQAVDTLKLFIEQSAETLLFLVGPEAVGKTHLLSAALHYVDEKHSFVEKNTSNVMNLDSAQAIQAGYFSLAELAGESLDQQTLSDLCMFFEGFDFLALDDLDLWLDSLDPEDPEARILAEGFLFAVFNYFKEHQKQLLIASKTVPARLNIQLNDLRSRLSSGLLVTMTKLNDHEKDQLIRASAKLRGFLLDDEVSAYILKRSGRDLPNLLDILEKLDKASLIEKRKLTVPFVKKILNW